MRSGKARASLQARLERSDLATTIGVARPPYGLGYGAAMVEAIQQETREMLLAEKVAEVKAQTLAADATVEALNTNGGDRKQNISELYYHAEERGTSALYLVRRLKRDRPDIATALAQRRSPRSGRRRRWRQMRRSKLSRRMAP